MSERVKSDGVCFGIISWMKGHNCAYLHLSVSLPDYIYYMYKTESTFQKRCSVWRAKANGLKSPSLLNLTFVKLNKQQQKSLSTSHLQSSLHIPHF